MTLLLNMSGFNQVRSLVHFFRTSFPLSSPKYNTPTCTELLLPPLPRPTVTSSHSTSYTLMVAFTLLQLRQNRGTKSKTNYSKCYNTTPFVAMSGSDGHLGTELKVHAQTGYSSVLLDHLWGKQMKEMEEFRPKQGKNRTKLYWYMSWVWIHSNCNSRSICRSLFTPQTKFISETTFRVRLKPMMSKMASIMDEIHWENRYLPPRRT